MYRGVLASSGISTAGAHPSMVACHTGNSFFLATGHCLQHVTVTPPTSVPEASGAGGNGSETNVAPARCPIPTLLDRVVEVPVPGCAGHCCDIRSVACNDGRVAAIDGRGVATVATILPASIDSDAGGCAVEHVVTYCPTDSVEEGWHGISLASQSSGASIVTASFWGRRVTLHDKEGTATRSIYTVQEPSRVTITEPGQVTPCAVIVAVENNTFTVYDGRVGESGGVVQRVSPSASASVTALATGPNYVACGDDDRIIHVFDSRKWSAAGRWTGATKTPVSFLHLSAVDPHCCFAAGVDSELVYGNWSDSHPGSERDVKPGVTSVRGAGRWLGLDRYADQDRLAGVCVPNIVHLVNDMPPCAAAAATEMKD